MVARNVSLGCSIKGTTSSKILATLQMTMKSLAVYGEETTLWKLNENGSI